MEDSRQVFAGWRYVPSASDKTFQPMTSGAQFDLNYLGSGSIPGVSPSIGAALAEAAGVCLESQGHHHGVEIQARGHIVGDYSVEWPPITEQSRRSWNDDQEATEYGASGIAILLIERETPYSVFERSQKKGTGIDYWLGDASDPKYRFTARLEVSGIRSGDSGRIRARVREKSRQTESADLEHGNMPVYIVVVEFGAPLAEVLIK